MRKLKNVIDQSDSFVGAHRIVHARSYKRKPPSWACNDRKVRDLLLRSFPKMASDKKQHEASARWGAVIHLYFRMGYTESQVAEEIGSTTTKVHFVVRSIFRVSKGLRANGTGALGAKRGRPKNNRALVQSF